MDGQRRSPIMAPGPAGRSQEEDTRLLGLVLQGDRPAFEELYRLYRPRLARFLLNLVHRPMLAEEVLNDTMMVVWERAESFTGASKVSTWIFAIAYRKAMKGLRRLDDAVADSGDENHAAEAGPDEEAWRDQSHARLRAAIAELSPEHRAVVDLTYFHDLGYREVARILECPVNTVKTRMFHARRHLKRRLEGELADWI